MILTKLKKKFRRRKAKEINRDERRKERMTYLENKLESLKQRAWTPRTFYLASIINYELTQLAEKLGIKTHSKEKEKEIEEHTGDSA